MSDRVVRASAWLVMLAFAVPIGADAARYQQVNATASQITFTYHQMGSRVYGTFSRFEATIDFDSANPAAARAALTIDLDSIDVGNRDANSELKKTGWFNTAVYPQARFVSNRVTALGNNRYQVEGLLTLKGLTRGVGAQITLKPESAIGIFDGNFILKRADFDIGEGEWADFGVVSNEINIRFRVVVPEQ
ncbi:MULTISPECIES: YceI family protein [unclassified Pseudomonas]|uniref:YceI family protein n=1 Tax=unclassified Pseudomonas TaxID=196821 RepID=UPI000BA2E1E6|nr:MULTISPECIES: YceI family protein [unclassified Pseudomonas]